MPKQKLLAATAALLQTCAQNCPTAMHTSVLYSSKNTGQNEDWPSHSGY
jgi:hypothetical protein